MFEYVTYDRLVASRPASLPAAAANACITGLGHGLPWLQRAKGYGE